MNSKDKKRKDKERKKAQERAEWEKENQKYENIRTDAPQKKAKLRAQGCVLPFYDYMDSYEDEFRKMVNWARQEFRSLHEVYEMTADELEKGWQQHGLPGDWTHLKFKCDDERAQSYNDPDPSAGLRGGMTAFHDSSGNLHTIIEIANPKIDGMKHKEGKYAFKIPTLFHELGHVRDMENNLNFNRTALRANVIEAEVFAHLFALEQCYQRAYYMSAQVWLDSMAKHRDAMDYRGDVVRLVFERFKKPDFKAWLEYKI